MANKFENVPSAETEGKRRFRENERQEALAAAERASAGRKRASGQGRKSDGAGNEVDLTPELGEFLDKHQEEKEPFEEA